MIHLEFADDIPDESDDTWFKRHNRVLRSLREDTLLIVDNLNASASHDQFLDVMLMYRCRILFTTRSRYENYASLEVSELNPDTLLVLVGKFIPKAEKKQDEVKKIIDLLHEHTFAVELAARLQANGLLNKLKKEKAGLDAEDKIGTTKDGKNRKATYYEHIHSFFSLYKHSSKEQEILRSLTLISVNGISSRRFAVWMKRKSMNTINDLTEMGFFHHKNNREILLHPMIREVAVEELKPTVHNFSVQEAVQVLGEVHPGNAHLATNLHTSLGALYHKSGRIDLAKRCMEQGIHLLVKYNLIGYHDSVMQTCNYASLLIDMGEPQWAYFALLKLVQKIQELNSDQCLDDGLIQQAIGNTCVVKGDTAQEQIHYRRAMVIFDMVFEDEPALLNRSARRLDIQHFFSRQKNQKLIV